MRFLSCMPLFLLLAACGGGDHEDLKQWAADNTRQMTPRIAKLPEVMPYQPVAYDVEVLPDPFLPTRIEPEGRQQGTGKAGRFQPDFEARELRNSALEKYPLESLKMIGSLNINQRPMAVIQVEDKIKQVRVGDYLGLDFGRIKRITETEVELRELVQDAAGDWSERDSVLHLQSKEGSKK